MANKKITDLNEATSVSGNDWLVIVDVANDETKKVHANQVGGNIPIQDTAPSDPEEDDLWIDTSEEGFDNSNVVNQYSTSDTDVYSCSYVNDCETYSTSEVKTNKVWIDGKPIYRIVYEMNFAANETVKSQATSSLNASTYITIKAISTSDPIAEPYYTANDDKLTVVINGTNKIAFVTLGGSYPTKPCKVYLIIEYTKTTD